MPVSDTAVRLPLSAITHVTPSVRKLFAFGVIILAVYCGDGIMSYIAPVLIEKQLGSALLMGVIMSTSSVFGLAFDVFAGKIFKDASYQQFTKWLLLLAISFPLILLLLPHEAPVLIAAMAVWGVYYEITKFSQFAFVKQHMHVSQHAFSWSVFEVLHAAGFVIGPLVAGVLLLQGDAFPLAAASIFFFIAVVCFKLLLSFHKPTPTNKAVPQRLQNEPSDVRVLHTWELLSRKLWPLLLVTFSLVLIDTAFMSVGTLLAEELKVLNPLGLFLIPAYSSPFLLMPWFSPIFSRYFGKKRTAFMAGMFGGGLLVAGSMTTTVPMLLGFVFLASLCLALAYPEMNATFEDYVVRVGRFGNTLVGLQSSMFSLAYIVGPVTAGYIATSWGNERALMAFGSVLSIISIVALIATPRKIRLPQTEMLKG